MRARLVTLVLAAGIGLGGCAYGYDPYGGGYGGVSVGYGNYGYGGYRDYGYYNPYYYGGYGYPYGGLGGYYGGSSYYGWNNGFYYPGTGYYVYDRYRRAHRWTDAQRDYWEWRRKGSRSGTGGGARAIAQWGDFNQGVQVINGTNGTSSIRTRSGRGERVSGTTSTRSDTVRVRSRSSDDGERPRRRGHDND
jgi:hypothetical protein